MTLRPSFPRIDQHLAMAGMTGSGKTTGALDMLTRRMNIPWLVIDHKTDSKIKSLRLPRLSLSPLVLPDSGLWHIKPDKFGNINRFELERLLKRVFLKGHFGVYVDEGHLMGFSEMIRNILVAGRDRKVPLMWISQRAQSIDPFVWSQSEFARCYRLKGPLDIKRFNDNFIDRYERPANFHSHYLDGTQGEQFYLGPSAPMDAIINRLDRTIGKTYSRV